MGIVLILHITIFIEVISKNYMSWQKLTAQVIVVDRSRLWTSVTKLPKGHETAEIRNDLLQSGATLEWKVVMIMIIPVYNILL